MYCALTVENRKFCRFNAHKLSFSYATFSPQIHCQRTRGIYADAGIESLGEATKAGISIDYFPHMCSLLLLCERTSIDLIRIINKYCTWTAFISLSFFYSAAFCEHSIWIAQMIENFLKITLRFHRYCIQLFDQMIERTQILLADPILVQLQTKSQRISKHLYIDWKLSSFKYIGLTNWIVRRDMIRIYYIYHLHCMQEESRFNDNRTTISFLSC